MRRWKERLWPTITDPGSEERAVERAARISTLWAIVSLALGLIAILPGTRVAERSPFEPNAGETVTGSALLLSGAFYGVLAWKIRRMSRGWAQGGLVLTSFAALSNLAVAPSPIALVMEAVVLVYFINAVRATFRYERLQAERPLPERLP